MSKTTKQIRNRELLITIRKGLAAEEDLMFASIGYYKLLKQTQAIIYASEQNILPEMSDEYREYIVGQAKRVNERIVKWRNEIDARIAKDEDKYLPIFFFKWFGINYIYSIHVMYKKTFSYLGCKTTGTEISHAIANYTRRVKQISKVTTKAREMLINENNALIYSVARKVAGDRTDIIDDLISVSYYEFIKCMDRTFDMNRGTEFSTHVATCMFKKCKEAKIKHDEIVKVPTARMADKTKAAKGELDLSAYDIEDDLERAKESLVRSTISNSNMYWSLDTLASDNDEDKNSEHLVSDGNIMRQISDNVVVSDIVQRIIDKILTKQDRGRVKNITKIKALEYSGALDFFDEMGEQTLQDVASRLYEEGYTETRLSAERARQLINDGKELIRRQIVKDEEFMDILGINRAEVNA